MSKHAEDDYIFPCVAIRSEEVNLLSQEDIGRLIEQKTVQGALNILYEFGYGDGKELSNPRDYDKVLNESLDHAYELVYSVITDEEEMNLFRYPSDYHNIKVLLKSEALKNDSTGFLLNSGVFPKDQISEMVRKRDFSQMSVIMRAAVEEALDVFAKTHDPQEVDIILDKACYKDMLSDAENTENDFVAEYVRLQIDLINANTFNRLKDIGKPGSFFKKVFIPGGNRDESMIESYVNELAQDFKNLNFEKKIDDIKMDYLKDAQFIPFGIEPIVGFISAKETEVRNLRMILTGIISGMSSDAIESRLRDTYV